MNAVQGEDDQVQLIADGETVYVKRQPFTVILHEGSINVEAPNHFVIGPEQTMEVARTLEPDQWALIREHEKFLKPWKALWQEVSPPEDLQKASMALKHSVGMILMLFESRVQPLPVHIQYPETYLHPRQQASLVTMLMTFGFNPGK